MKKMLKILGIILLVLLACFAALLLYLNQRPAAPTDYQTKTATGGKLEARYLANGAYAVSGLEQTVLQGFGKYILYYPSELAEKAETYPVIVLCNGSGTPLSKYPAVAKHLASWGFLVIGTEETYDWNGFAAEMCIRYLTLLNDNPTIEKNENNIFYQKINLEKVGIVGHSQGGVGVMNAITTQAHHTVFKAAVSLSPTNQQLARNLLWDYDAAQIQTPILLMSGEGGGDDWVVTGEQLQAIYAEIPSEKVMLRRKSTSHGEMLYAASGYVTAWFCYLLQEDAEAAKAFTGETPEILRNALYTDQALMLTGAQQAE